MPEAILRINMKSQIATREAVPSAWNQLGGRGLIARILLDEIPSRCEPLGPQNILIFAPGLLVGHRLSSCDRISIGGKSPLTGGVKESNAGGRTGYALANLGIKAMIIEDVPPTEVWHILYMDKKGVEFHESNRTQDSSRGIVGLGVYESTTSLLDVYGEDVAIALIGPGGEMGLSAAGIQNIDKDRVPSRIAARGGLGAVMGSKGIKAIIIDPKDGDKPPIKDEEMFQAARKSYTEALMSHPQTKTYDEYGTAAMTSMSNAFGALPTRNYSRGQFEEYEKISGDSLRDLLLQRSSPSETSHACMQGCGIRCSNIVGDERGNILVSPLEYETIGMMGSNLGIDDLDTIARLNYELNDLGLDSIEIGAALGVAAEAGLMDFGDGERALELVDEIRQGTPLGRMLGRGAALTGKTLGVERVPVVKNQAMSAYDPRAIKGTGVTYATSPQGADHTAGLTIRSEVDHTDPKGQNEISRTAQIKMAGYDTLGACIFSGFGFSVIPEILRDLINARYGWGVDDQILITLGRITLQLEREFNKGAGFTSADDRLPKWMTREPLPPLDSVFDVPEEDLDKTLTGLDKRIDTL